MSDPSQEERPPQSSGAPSIQNLPPGVRALPSLRDPAAANRWRNEFLPALFQRLLDDAPHQSSESASAYAPTRRQIKELVQRDLVYLLNTINHEDLINKERHPEVLNTTVNYGVPAFSGSYSSEKRWEQVAQAIHTAILRFEPRILPESLRVTPLLHGDVHAQYNVLVFEISGLLHLEPYPQEFSVQSSVDLETQQMTLSFG